MAILFGSKNWNELDLLEISQFHFQQAKSKYESGELKNAAISFAVADVYETRGLEAYARKKRGL